MHLVEVLVLLVDHDVRFFKLLIVVLLDLLDLGVVVLLGLVADFFVLLLVLFDFVLKQNVLFHGFVVFTVQTQDHVVSVSDLVLVLRLQLVDFVMDGLDFLRLLFDQFVNQVDVASKQSQCANEYLPALHQLVLLHVATW